MDIDVFFCVLCHYQKKVLKSSFSEKQEVAMGLEKLLEALYVVAVVSLKVLGLLHLALVPTNKNVCVPCEQRQ